MKKSTKNTIILIVVILLIALSMIMLQRFVLAEHGTYAVVAVDGKEQTRLNLKDDQVLTVTSPYGGYNTIEVKNHKVCVTEADCENQVCVATGEISENYELIVCLPHALTITIETE